MGKMAVVATGAVIALERESHAPLFRQIEANLSAAIIDGVLKPGTRLPSTRSFAESLGVARNTVVLAFDELLGQGFLEARVGAGTYVAARSPHVQLPRVAVGQGDVTPSLGLRGTRLSRLAVTQVRQCGPPGPFRAGVPAVDLFGIGAWMRGEAKVQRQTSDEMLGYGEPGGYWGLRQAVCDFLGATRAVRCAPEQVIIVSGSQQGLDLSARLLVDAGDRVWVEDPSRSGAASAFAAADLFMVPVPVDDEGMNVQAGIDRAPNVRLAYVSPSYQFPLGVTLSLRRRHELVAWARAVDAWIVEDDYDCEFRFDGSPLASIQGMAPERTVYIGTFSRTLFPSLRLGYLVVPKDAVETFERARALVDRQSPIWAQATLAKFIADGDFNRHLRRMRGIYLSRREALFEHADKLLGGLLTLRPNVAGLHVVGTLAPGLDDLRAEEAAARRGIDVTALSRFAMETPRDPALVMGYGAVSGDEMHAAVSTLADALRDGR